MDLKELKKFWKLITTERVTISRRVFIGPCFLFSCHVEPTDGGAVVDAHFYDGVDTTGEEKLCFTNQYGSARFQPVIPLYFSHGLYLYLETNVTSITVQYMSEELLR